MDFVTCSSLAANMSAFKRHIVTVSGHFFFIIKTSMSPLRDIHMTGNCYLLSRNWEFLFTSNYFGAAGDIWGRQAALIHIVESSLNWSYSIPQRHLPGQGKSEINWTDNLNQELLSRFAIYSCTNIHCNLTSTSIKSIIWHFICFLVPIKSVPFHCSLRN